MLGKLPKFHDDRLIVGLETSDDAAIYKITDDIAMIQTVDFFTPVVDDPYVFGQVAAANSLSDVYAMGGEPKVALNIVGFPNCLDVGILGDILAGGASKVMEAGATLAGGHSIQDDEPKYGLCVTGFVHPDKIFKNYGAKPGDVLILTKQIGSGVVNTAIKAGMAARSDIDEAAVVMTSLNKKAQQVIRDYPVSSCTDVTGFGLAGHAFEMAEASRVSFEIDVSKIPLMAGAVEYTKSGLVPAGAYKNRGYSEDRLDAGGVPEHMIDLLYDPQTSGGLLISVAEEYAPAMMRGFEAVGMDTRVAVIGRVLPEQEKLIILNR